MKKSKALSAGALMILLAGAGCLDTGDTVIDGKPATGVDVNSGKPSIQSGAAVQFAAILQFADGTSKDVTSDPATVWNSSDAAIASVSAVGMVVAKNGGLVDVSADYKGEKGNNRFAVTP
jgi:hypothetical protein